MRKYLTGQFSLNSRCGLSQKKSCLFPPFSSATSYSHLLEGLIVQITAVPTCLGQAVIISLLHCWNDSEFTCLPLAFLPSNLPFPPATRANLVKHRSGPIPLRIKSLGGSHLTFLSHLWCLHSASCTLHPALHHAHAPAGLQMENLCLLSACLSSTHPSGFSSSLSNIPSVPLRTSQTYLSLI